MRRGWHRNSKEGHYITPNVSNYLKLSRWNNFCCKQALGGVTLSRFLLGAHVRQIQHLDIRASRMFIDRSRRDFSAADHPGNNFGWFGKTASCLELNGESKNVRMKRSEMVDGTTCTMDDRETQRRGNILLQMSQTIQVESFLLQTSTGRCHIVTVSLRCACAANSPPC